MCKLAKEIKVFEVCRLWRKKPEDRFFTTDPILEGEYKTEIIAEHIVPANTEYKVVDLDITCSEPVQQVEMKINGEIVRVNIPMDVEKVVEKNKCAQCPAKDSDDRTDCYNCEELD